MNTNLPSAVDAGQQAPESAGMGIAAVERDTGIGKETLRVWERRYGFPMPQRDAAGERVYPPEQVQRLRLVKRLLDGGHRPGRVVAAPLDALQALLQPAPVAAMTQPAEQLDGDDERDLQACIDSLKRHDLDGLRRQLSQAVLRRGLAGSVTGLFAPLTTRVGDLWWSGELQVFEEHVFSESLQSVLRQAMQGLPAPAPQAPRVLLATLPGEAHSLGLLMAETLFRLEGCHCLPVGVQTPAEQLVAAARAFDVQVVALSFSGYLPARAVQEGLTQLREQLDAGIQLWAGGSHRLLRGAGLPGVVYLPELGDIAPALARCRDLLESPL